MRKEIVRTLVLGLLGGSLVGGCASRPAIVATGREAAGPAGNYGPADGYWVYQDGRWVRIPFDPS